MRLAGALLCSLALGGCPQFVKDDFSLAEARASAGTRPFETGGNPSIAGSLGQAPAGAGSSLADAAGAAGSAHGYSVAGQSTSDNSSGAAGVAGGGRGATSLGGAGGIASVCDSVMFSSPERITGLGLFNELWGPTLGADGKSLYFSVWDGIADRIYVATRPDRGTAFSSAVQVTIQDATTLQATPFISADGQTLYFVTYAQQGSTDRDIWIASRSDTSSNRFASPRTLDNVNSMSSEGRPWLSSDELTLLFASTRTNGATDFDIWTAARSSRSASFSNPTKLANVNSPNRDESPVLSADGSTLYFASDRSGTYGLQDIWFATRTDSVGDFEVPTAIRVLNTEDIETDPALSNDETELFFVSDRSGRPEIWRSLRTCE